VCPETSCADLICHIRQYFRRQKLPNTGFQYFMESVHETDWRLRRIRLGEEMRFVMRMEDIMRHVSNELWNTAWWWTAVWC